MITEKVRNAIAENSSPKSKKNLIRKHLSNYTKTIIRLIE